MALQNDNESPPRPDIMSLYKSDMTEVLDQKTENENDKTKLTNECNANGDKKEIVLDNRKSHQTPITNRSCSASVVTIIIVTLCIFFGIYIIGIPEDICAQSSQFAHKMNLDQSLLEFVFCNSVPSSSSTQEGPDSAWLKRKMLYTNEQLSGLSTILQNIENFIGDVQTKWTSEWPVLDTNALTAKQIHTNLLHNEEISDSDVSVIIPYSQLTNLIVFSNQSAIAAIRSLFGIRSIVDVLASTIGDISPMAEKTNSGETHSFTSTSTSRNHPYANSQLLFARSDIIDYNDWRQSTNGHPKLSNFYHSVTMPDQTKDTIRPDDKNYDKYDKTQLAWNTETYVSETRDISSQKISYESTKYIKPSAHLLHDSFEAVTGNKGPSNYPTPPLEYNLYILDYIPSSEKHRKLPVELSIILPDLTYNVGFPTSISLDMPNSEDEELLNDRNSLINPSSEGTVFGQYVFDDFHHSVEEDLKKIIKIYQVTKHKYDAPHAEGYGWSPNVKLTFLSGTSLLGTSSELSKKREGIRLSESVKYSCPLLSSSMDAPNNFSPGNDADVSWGKETVSTIAFICPSNTNAIQKIATDLWTKIYATNYDTRLYDQTQLYIFSSHPTTMTPEHMLLNYARLSDESIPLSVKYECFGSQHQVASNEKQKNKVKTTTTTIPGSDSHYVLFFFVCFYGDSSKSTYNIIWVREITVLCTQLTVSCIETIMTSCISNRGRLGVMPLRLTSLHEKKTFDYSVFEEKELSFLWNRLFDIWTLL